MAKMRERKEGSGAWQPPSFRQLQQLDPSPDNDSASVRIMPKFERPFSPLADQLPVGPKSE